MRSKNQYTKRKLKMGTGDKENYRPFIEVGEFGSLGTAACVVDYKTGRSVHLLSQAEIIAWYLLRWEDNVIDIKEQYPLNIKETLKIAEDYGVKHPFKNDEPIILTTDLYVISNTGNLAVSIKASKNNLNYNNLFIEKKYWENHSVHWKLISKEEFNIIRYKNIRNVVPYYNLNFFPDEISFIKFLIARKLLIVDMDKPLDYWQIITERKDEIEKWKVSSLKLAK